MTTFHVQGRRIERRGRVVVRDETRRVDAATRHEALGIAQTLGGGGFTVWVWAVDAGSAPAIWDLVGRVDPVPARRPPSHARTRGH